MSSPKMDKMLKSTVDTLFGRRPDHKKKETSATPLLQNISAIQNHLQSSSSNVDDEEDNVVVQEHLLPDLDRVRTASRHHITPNKYFYLVQIVLCGFRHLDGE